MKLQRITLGAIALAIAVVLTWYGLASNEPPAGDAIPHGATAPVALEPSNEPVPAPAFQVADETPSLRSSATESLAEEAPESVLENRASEPVSRWIEGRTLDPRGMPIGGVQVSNVQVLIADEPEVVLALSDGDGRFRFLATNEKLSLAGRRHGFVTVYSALVGTRATPHETRIVLAPAVELAGRVVDVDGLGIQGITLVVANEGPRLVDFPFPLDKNSASFMRVVSGPDGTFELREAPRIDGYRLQAYGAGYTRTSVEVPDTSRYDLLITLERAEVVEKLPPRIFGVVTLPDGEPARGASVSCGSTRTTTNDEGRFELATAPFRELYSPVVARLDGWQPAVWQAESESSQPFVLQTGPLYLVLPGPALSIQGRLEFADGSPANGWHLRLIEPRARSEQGGSELPHLLVPEGKSVTDAEGAFEIEGLAPGEVVLRLWSEDSCGAFDSAPIEPGTTDLVLRVPEPLLYASLAGRVTFGGGVPVVGAKVEVHFPVKRSSVAGSSRRVARSTTNSDGAFELKNVPRIGALLDVTGEGFAEFVLEPPNGDLGPGPLAIEVRRLIQARVDASTADPLPSAYRILDDRGEPLTIARLLDGGRSGVFQVSESAGTLVLLRGDLANPEEVSRHPITLVPGEVNILMP